MKPRAPRVSRTEQTQIIMPAHINGYGRLFGGQLMQWIDVTAGVAARRHAGREVTTAAVDQLVFRGGAYVNSTLVMAARVTWTGRTSMEICVDTYVEALSGERTHVNRAYLVMVAIDEKGAPTPVPPLAPETDEERQEYAAGEKRQALRKTRRAENY